MKHRFSIYANQSTPVPHNNTLDYRPRKARTHSASFKNRKGGMRLRLLYKTGPTRHNARLNKTTHPNLHTLATNIFNRIVRVHLDCSPTRQACFPFLICVTP